MDQLEWLQVDCSLFAQLDGTPFLPWHSLREAVETWRDDDLFQWFWFVRKMPGLKLRFGGPNINARMQGRLAEWLHSAERSNAIRGFRFTVYEPEVYRFGGDAGMALTHTHFSRAAKLFLDFETRDEITNAERLNFSFANTSDLLERVLADEAEIWDVWMRLYVLVGQTSDAAEAKLPSFEDLSEQSPGLADLIVSAQTANAACATSLRALVEGGVLTVGIRSWLTAATTFEWNRFGLPDHPEALTAAIVTFLRHHQPDVRTCG